MAELHYTYRVWSETRNRYLWAKVDGSSKALPNGHTLIYAMYTDITEQKEAELELETTSESLTAALNVSSQLSYEYDPINHVGICYTDENFFNLPKRIENYPASLASYDLFHPDDAHLFYEAARKMDEGAHNAQCDIRIKKDGEYRWYSCVFEAHYNEELGRNVVILIVSDITLRVSASTAVEKRVESLMYVNEEVLCVSSFNLTRDIITDIKIKDDTFSGFESVATFSDAINAMALGFPTEEGRQAFLASCNREALIEAAQMGKTSVKTNSIYRLGPSRTEWVEIVVELIPNLVTGEIEGVSYAENVNRRRFSALLLENGLSDKYPMAAILIDEGNEYYLFDKRYGVVCMHRTNYWEDIRNQLIRVGSDEKINEVFKDLTQDAIFAVLNAGEIPEFAFDTFYDDLRRRYSLSFSRCETNPDIVLAILHDVTDKELDERMRHDARHDALTDLYNRQTVFAHCRELIEAHPDEHLCMMSINVKRFRLYNTFFGEKAGDDLLCAMANGMRAFGAGYEYCAYGRVEADIFCALFPMDEGLFERQIEFVKNHFATYRPDFLLEPSIGLYEIDDSSLSVESIFARAVTAAKVGGTSLDAIVNRYNAQMENKLTEELTITNEMNAAIENHQFAVYLQPKYNLHTGKHAGAEALARWIHPTKGLIPPDKFIPVFESNGFIATLDRYMWEETCKLLRKWTDEGSTVMPVSVNVSRVSAYNHGTVQVLKDLITKYDLDPALLELELTESAYIDDPEDLKRILADLQSFGFKILMDDFGSGYSSLNTLRDLTVDVLKLDRKFLSESCEDYRGRTVLSSTVDMARSLSLSVVAEGVETKEQADFLRSIGCDYAQGFLYARPMPVADYEALR